MSAWTPAGMGEPDEKRRDLTVPGFWALTGPGLFCGWDWTVISDQTGESVAGADAPDEATAQAAVDAWEEAAGVQS